jgi:hypothetical protein
MSRPGSEPFTLVNCTLGKLAEVAAFLGSVEQIEKRFSVKVQAGDRIVIEISAAEGLPWLPVLLVQA